jgi:hypothetical protein
VKAILAGQENIDAKVAIAQKKRLPVTLSVLKLLKIELNNIDETYEYKRLIWAVSTLNFFGCLRVHESLSRSVTCFDPLNTLLGKDLLIKSVLIGKQKVRIIQLKIKSPKETREYFLSMGLDFNYNFIQGWELMFVDSFKLLA